MDLSDLRIFTAVVREGGITRAAERLHRVQSNVTTRIRQLEDDLGVRLFIREGRKLRISPAGRTLLDYADRLLTLSDEAVAAVQDRRPGGVFRLGSMESTAAVRLPGPLTEFSARYPDVVLEMRTGNPGQLAAALKAGEIDGAFVAETLPADGFDNIVAFSEEPVIVTAANQPPVGKGGNVPKTILVFEQGCPHRKQLEAWYESRGEKPERTLELGSYHAMMGCALAGMGAALLPRSVLATFPESRRLRIHDLPKSNRTLRTMFIWPKGAGTPNVLALAEILERNGLHSEAAA